jgi:hypothetical protein
MLAILGKGEGFERGRRGVLQQPFFNRRIDVAVSTMLEADFFIGALQKVEARSQSRGASGG